MKWVLRIGGALVALLLVVLITLVAMGHRADAGRIRATVEIGASPEQLWPWVNDRDKLTRWVSWLVDVREETPDAAVGARRVWVMKDENNGGAPMEILGVFREYIPMKRLTVAVSSGDAFDGVQTYEFTDLGNGRTRMDIDSHFHFGARFAQLMEPVISPAARKKLVGDLGRLKALVEEHASVPQPAR